jgi:hypothetical protein
MSVRVRFVDKDGNTVKVFDSLKEAAVEACCTASTLGWRVRNNVVFNGLRAEYMPIERTEKQEKRRQQYRERVARQKREGKRAKTEASGKRDDMTIEQKERMIAEFAERGSYLDVVKYELRNGILPITTCRRKETVNLEERPMIGGMKCIACRSFKGRCRITREVLCGFRYKK